MAFLPDPAAATSSNEHEQHHPEHPQSQYPLPRFDTAWSLAEWQPFNCWCTILKNMFTEAVHTKMDKDRLTDENRGTTWNELMQNKPAMDPSRVLSATRWLADPDSSGRGFQEIEARCIICRDDDYLTTAGATASASAGAATTTADGGGGDECGSGSCGSGASSSASMPKWWCILLLDDSRC